MGFFSPGSKSMADRGRWVSDERLDWNLSAILMGVVRQDVNRSAGRCGSDGSDSVARHAHMKMCVQSYGSADVAEISGDVGPPPTPPAFCSICATFSLRCRMK